MKALEADSSREIGGGAFTFPLSFAQERLWFLDRLQQGSSTYNVPLALRLTGALDVEALEEALNAVVERHEALRTTFADEEGEPLQVVHVELRVPVAVVDLAGVPAGEREDALESALLVDGLEPFDLAQAPLLRAHLYRLGEDEHALLLTVHHIVADGWSLGIVLRELAELYRARVTGETPDLEEPALQYGDFAVWQRDWLRGERLAEEVEYWRRRLEGASTIVDLAPDRPRPSVQSDRGDHVGTIFPLPLLERLRSVSRSEGATLFMTLLAAFDVLLARYSGQDDIVVGTPIANRTRVELESIVGFFVNTIVLRASTEGNPTFRELIGRVRELTLDAYTHQDLPFEKLVAELNPDRALSHSPLFQVMFALQTPAGGSVELPGLAVEPIDFERGTSKFDLGVFARETASGLRLSCEYSTDLFKRSRIERLLGHFRSILEALAEDPDRRIGEVELLTEPERAELGRWNTTAAAHPFSGLCVQELVEAQARRTPAATAAVFGGGTLTYEELDGRANRLAHRLRELGVGPGVSVAISLQRSLELPVAVLATLKAGGAYVPLDPSYPQERLSLMLREAAAPVVLTQRSLAAGLPLDESQVLLLDEDLGEAPATAPERLGGPGDPAYVLFTSGSTGQPKGVRMPHRVLTNLLAWQLDSWDEPGATRTLQFASLSFDVAFQELFSTLAAGGTLVLVDEETRRDAVRLLAVLDEQHVERLFVPFVALQQLAEGAAYEGVAPRHLREVLTAGEALLITPAIRAFFELTGARLRNQYGPTEAHVVTEHPLEGWPGKWPERPPIGRPIWNAKIHILDRFGHLAPVGVPGELFIAGGVVADGYVNRPELTAERFVADPFSSTLGARMYRTGDVARRLDDGNIEYLGRSDRQVKVRGYRVEPAEAEVTLQRDERVREAAVVVDGEGDARRLVAYVVPVAPVTEHELRASLAKILPEFMVPSAIVLLDALPLTPSGKIDRRSLPSADGPTDRAELVLPRDDTEQQLADIWRRLLGVARPVGVDEDFFDLGGHSLLAVRVFAEIERQLGVKLPLNLLFRRATIEHLADEIRARREQSQPWPCLVPLQTEGKGAPLFLMHGVDGELLFYRDFLRNLPPDLPVYALQPIGLDRRSLPSTSLAEMASTYADAILEFMPDGPHLLCGYCFAGVLAYEVGRQLERRGSPPALLALIDASPFGHYQTPSRAELERRKLQEFLQADLRGKRSWIARRFRGLVVKVKLKSRWAAFDALLRARLPVPGFLWTMKAAGERAMRQYVTPTSPCHVTLFRAADASSSYYNRSLWTKLAEGGVDIHPIIADGVRHDNILREPYVREVIRDLTDTIARALEEHVHRERVQEG